MAGRKSIFFIRDDGIDREVITTDICRYLGLDAQVKPGNHMDPETGQVNSGYYITSYRPPTSAQLSDLKANSSRWREEKLRNSYQYNTAARTIEQLVPTKKDLPIYLNWPFNSSLCRACADFGAAANIIDANYARQINVSIIPEVACEPFELPTYGTLIYPIGRAIISCAFPGEIASRKDYEFFVFENFVYPVIMGREFLRETETLDRFQHRLYDRRIVRREIPIVASLGAKEETLTAFVDGERLDSFPDTGSEINVMDLDYALKRGFHMTKDDINRVQFADGSLQDVVGRVTAPLSFSNRPFSGVLVKLVYRLSAAQDYLPSDIGEIKNTRHLDDLTIAAEFYVLRKLKTSIILGEDLLATVNAFVCLSGNFKPVTSPTSLYPALAIIGLIKSAEKGAARMVKRTVREPWDLKHEVDILDSREADRYEGEVDRISSLPLQERTLAKSENNRRNQEYRQARSELLDMESTEMSRFETEQMYIKSLPPRDQAPVVEQNDRARQEYLSRREVFMQERNLIVNIPQRRQRRQRR